MNAVAIENLFKQIKQPEYLYGIYGDFVGWGIVFGIVFLIAANIIKSAQIQMVALGLIAVACLTIIPANKQRNAAGAKVTQAITPGHTKLFKEQTTRQHEYRWIYYVMAILAIGSLSLRQAKLGPTIIVFTYIWGIITIGWSAYLHTKESDLSKMAGQLSAPAPTAAPANGAKPAVKAASEGRLGPANKKKS